VHTDAVPEARRGRGLRARQKKRAKERNKNKIETKEEAAAVREEKRRSSALRTARGGLGTRRRKES
jgi:hypothetical protein